MPFLLYNNTISHDYAYDDHVIILDNPVVQKGIAGIPTLFKNAITFRGKSRVIYRPIAYTTHALEWQFFKDNPNIGHFVNILLYTIAVLLLFRFLLLLFKDQPPLFAFLITVLFTIHPIHVESVANIKGRDDILCLIGFLMSVIAFLKYLDTRSTKWAVYTVLGYAFSFLSKEIAIPLMAVYPVIIYFYTKDNWKIVFKRKGIIAVLALIFLIPTGVYLAGYLLGNLKASNIYNLIDNPMLGAETAGERWGTTIYVWVYYLKLLFIPYPLVYYYGFNHISLTNFADYRVWLSIIAVGLLAFYAIRELRKKSIIAFGFLFYAITFSIFAHLVLGAAIVAERYLFMPSLGFCIVIIALLFQYGGIDHKKSLTKQSLKAKVLLGLLFLAYLVGAFITIDRNKDWKNNLTLYANDIKWIDGASQAHSNLAIALIRKDSEGNKEKALSHFEKALAIYKSPSNHRVLGEAYMQFRDTENAKDQFQKALKLNPNGRKTHLKLGYTYYTDRLFEDAIRHLEKAFELNYVEEKTYYFLARAYCRKANPTATDYKRAIELLLSGKNKYPDNIDIQKDLGRVYTLSVNYQKAISIFKEMEKKTPNDKDIVEGLFKAYTGLGQLEQAEVYKQKLQ